MFTNSLHRLMAVLVAMTVLATGCYSLDSNLSVNEDGSGTFVAEFLIDKDTSPDTLQVGNDLVAPCDAATSMRNVAPAGAIFTELDGGGECGARLEMTFADLDELQAGLNSLSSEARFSAFGHFPAVAVTESNGNWSMEAQFKAPVPDTIGDQAAFRDEVGAGQFNFAVKLPGRQVQHNATRIAQDGSMVWEINPLVDGSKTLFVQTEPGATILGESTDGGFPTGLLFLIMLLAAGMAAAMIVGNSRRKRQYEGDEEDDGEMIEISERLGMGRKRVKDAGTDVVMPDFDDADAPALAGPASAERVSLFGAPESSTDLTTAGPELHSDNLGGSGSEPDSESVRDLGDQLAMYGEAAEVADSSELDEVPDSPPPAPAPMGVAPASVASWPAAPFDDVASRTFGDPASTGEAEVLDTEPVANTWLTDVAKMTSTEPAEAPPAPQVPSGNAWLSHDELGDFASPDNFATAPNDVASPALIGADAPAAELDAPAMAAPNLLSETSRQPAWPQGTIGVATAEAADAGPAAWPQPVESSLAAPPAMPESSLAPPAAAAPEVQSTLAPPPMERPTPQPESVVEDTPTLNDMTWDPQRNAYVLFDKRRNAWMLFDDATQSWSTIERS